VVVVASVSIGEGGMESGDAVAERKIFVKEL